MRFFREPHDVSLSAQKCNNGLPCVFCLILMTIDGRTTLCQTDIAVFISYIQKEDSRQVCALRWGFVQAAMAFPQHNSLKKLQAMKMTKFCYIEIRHQGSAGLASQPGFYVDESPLSKWKKQAIFKKNTVQINHINNDKLLSLME